LETVTSEAGKAAKATAAMVAATAGATITVTETTSHPGEMIMITMAIGEIEAAKADPPGIWEDETHGATAPPHPTHVTVIGL
jgi:hypothetical protein